MAPREIWTFYILYYSYLCTRTCAHLYSRIAFHTSNNRIYRLYIYYINCTRTFSDVATRKFSPINRNQLPVNSFISSSFDTPPSLALFPYGMWGGGARRARNGTRRVISFVKLFKMTRLKAMGARRGEKLQASCYSYHLGM